MKKNAMSQDTTVIGVCWYVPDEWGAVKASATDADLFENTFAEWEAMAGKSFAMVRRAHPKALKVYIQAEELLAWCHLRARVNSSDARVEFVSEKVQTLIPQRQNANSAKKPSPKQEQN